MAIWLWINDLDAPGRNDWIEVSSVTTDVKNPGLFVTWNEIHLTIDPGRFGPMIMNRMVKASASTAWVFHDPQTEFEYSEAVISHVQWGPAVNKKTTMMLTLNFTKIGVTYSGSP